MTAIRLLHLLALVLAAASAGCGSSRLFSRYNADDDADRPRATQGDRNVADERAQTAEQLRELWNDDRNPVSPVNNHRAASGMTTTAVLPVSENLERAEQALAEQRLTTARRHLDAIIGQQPAHPRAHHLLAVVSDLEGRFGDAEHHYQTALQSDRNNAQIVGDLGYSYLMQERLDLAEQYLVQARTLDPSQVNAARNLALLYSRRGDFSGAQRTLAEVLPSADVQQTLARLFPGGPPRAFAATQQQASIPSVGDAPLQVSPTAYPYYGGNAPTASAGAARSLTLQDAAAHQSSMVVAPNTSSAMPNVAPPGANNPAGGYVVNQPNGRAARDHATMPPPEIAQTSADLPTHSTSSTTATRRWPPSTWPPQTGIVPAAAVDETSAPPTRTMSGVTYLMQRRTAAARKPQVVPNPAANSLSAAPGESPHGASNRAGTETSSTSSGPPPQYTSGPGSARIVTWPNRNGQSIDPSPPPANTGSHPSAAIGQPGATTPQQQTLLRASPGTAAGWNGGLYPPPQRQLPGSPPPVQGYPSQGAPIHAGAPTQQAAPPSAATIPTPHPGFVIAPNSAPPSNPLASYEDERRRFDQQLQQQVDQTYAQSPAGYIPPPSASMPAPTHQVPAWQPQTGDGAPVGPGGTPWYGQVADSPTRSPATAGQSAHPAVRPAATPASSANTPLTTPPYYRQTPAPHFQPAINPAP